ncbi:amino acid ABC transporter permease [Pseudogemmobacter sonorensis]|uniref:amino acid ABC transporter permease n=1 Tax=Pseudogemmobacter sonorensis TaxID=2989681 RepID=UPI0036B5FD3C
MARAPAIEKALRPYVRETMQTPELPPAGERGAVKWLRENLFSGPVNTLLTLAALAIVIWLVVTAFPWWWNSVWNANSLGECREIVAARGAESGACWAVIKARWHQYLFGFYPNALYWRPVLTFGLMFVALAPVLYWNDRKGAIMTAVAGGLTLVALLLIGAPVAPLLASTVILAGLAVLAWRAPKHLIYVTLLFPFVGFFLLWGGPIWKSVATLAGFGLLAVVYSLLKARLGVVVATGLGFVAAVFYWIVLQGYVTAALTGIANIGLIPINSDQFGGFLLAFVIGVTAISASLPLGILLALGRRSDMPLIKWLSVGFIEFIRGVPLITLLFTASLLLQYFLPPRTNFDLIMRVIILSTLFSAAYLAEVIRGGLAALPRGQYEAADALGLDYWQAQRLIVMPQALKISIPGIVSTFIGLFKDTTLVSFVGLMDPLRGVTQIVRADINWKGIYWEPYIFVGTLFFLICFGMSRYSMYLERKLKTDHR